MYKSIGTSIQITELMCFSCNTCYLSCANVLGCTTAWTDLSATEQPPQTKENTEEKNIFFTV